MAPAWRIQIQFTSLGFVERLPLLNVIAIKTLCNTTGYAKVYFPVQLSKFIEVDSVCAYSVSSDAQVHIQNS